MAQQLRADIEARREKVAALLLARKSLRQIARDLQTSFTTIQRDVVAVRAEWRARRLDLIDQRGSEDLARAEAAIAAIWNNVLAGNAAAIDRLLGLLRYRADVLGLNAPKMIDIELHIRERAEREGLNPDEAVAEAQRILKAGLSAPSR